MKRKIYIVDILVENLYSIRVESSSEERAEKLATKHALAGDIEPEEQQVDILDIYENDDWNQDN